MCCGLPYLISEPVYAIPSNVAFTGTLPLVPNSFSTSQGNSTYAPPPSPGSILAWNLYFFIAAALLPGLPILVRGIHTIGHTHRDRANPPAVRPAAAQTAMNTIYPAMLPYVRQPLD